MDGIWTLFAFICIGIILYTAITVNRRVIVLASIIATVSDIILYLMEYHAINLNQWSYSNTIEINGIPIELLIMYWTGAYILTILLYYTIKYIPADHKNAIPQAIFIGFGVLYIITGIMVGIENVPYFWLISTGAIAVGLFIGSERKTAVMILSIGAFILEAILDQLFIHMNAYDIENWGLTTPLAFMFGAMAIGSLLTNNIICSRSSRLCLIK